MKYRRKETIIEPVQFTDEINPPPGVFLYRGVFDEKEFYVVTIHKQNTKVVIGDWIMPEPDNVHHYPCKPDVFEKTYEPATPLTLQEVKVTIDTLKMELIDKRLITAGLTEDMVYLSAKHTAEHLLDKYRLTPLLNLKEEGEDIRKGERGMYCGTPVEELVLFIEDHNKTRGTYKQLFKAIELKFSIERLTSTTENKEVEVRPSNEFMHCNHFHEISDHHEIVNFGDGDFVANKEAIPLLKSLAEVGLRTRTHHIDKNTNNFVSIILDNATAEIQTINEAGSTRTKYNGKKEILIQWTNKKQ